ncbi:hypothetical protein [Kitasatospora sp. CB02891]|uniref:hypothetical protein n=1 Tax=Kitasatospora sp. CB02891 TaxID=2020329 RepID=UPI000C276FC1|nr:hypothetical protein [Kitasatospora sp. CB02891]PJN21153.1 hypothetical protein CG736_35015 [Kitasatospora sp. CB02891]
MKETQLSSYAQQKRTYEEQLSAHERKLAASSYGPDARARYIAEHGDPEIAELEWDEQILPAAEASGELPYRPVEPLSPREQAEQEARTRTYRELAEDPSYDVWAPETSETREYRQSRIEALTEELLPEFEAAEAALVEAEAVQAGFTQAMAEPDGLALDDEWEL